MNPVKNTLGQKLKSLRGERSLYQIEKESGIARSLLRRYEVGTLIPESDMLKRLAAFYGQSFQDFKILCFEDLYPEGSEDRQILRYWLQTSDTGDCR